MEFSLTHVQLPTESFKVLPSADFDAIGLCLAMEKHIPFPDLVRTVRALASRSLSEQVEPLRLELPRGLLQSTLEDCGGSVRALHEQVLRFSSALREGVSKLSVTFGSQKHLRVQHARLGRFNGVPIVHFAYEFSVSSTLHRDGEWESLQTELLQVRMGQHGVAAAMDDDSRRECALLS